MANVQPSVKISGYLEKKGKLRIGSSWKKYWFVLQGRLLLYYRSKDEYDAISPCKGTINLCPPCIIKPALSSPHVFQIECRANTVTLRSQNRSEQEKWMQALLSSTEQSKSSPNRMLHFRYSMDEIPSPERKADKKPTPILSRQNTMPYRIQTPIIKDTLIERLQHLGAHSYAGSLEAITRASDHHIYAQVNKREKPQSKDFVETVTVAIIENVPEKGSQEHLNFLIQNDHYDDEKNPKAKNAHSRISSDCEFEESTKLVPEYCEVHIDVAKSEPENVYSVPCSPKNDRDNTDHNKNVLVEFNETYVSSSPELSNGEEESKNNTREGEYEDVDMIQNQPDVESALYHEVQPLLPPRPETTKSNEQHEETSSQGSSNDKRKKPRFKILAQLLRSDKKTVERKPQKSRCRSRSFLQKVLGKKKSFEAEDDIVYETVDYAAIEKQEQDGKSDAEMLTELQRILESRKKMLQNKFNVKEDKGARPISCMEDSALIKVNVNVEERPSLPPRQNRRSISPYHDIPKSLSLPEQQSSSVKTIDAILEDLDRIENPQQNVKQLIDKFDNDEVVLRRNFNFVKSYSDTRILDRISRNSEDLNKLLEELGKVTSAPIMAPGVTSSLVTPTLTDDEWLELIPIRKRRLSDPDYDVPRPHRFLQLGNSKKNVADNSIPATRFFGPILPITSAEESNHHSTISWCSLDPDSLEIERLPYSITKSSTHPTISMSTTVSHNVENDRSVSTFSVNNANAIYAEPKSILRRNPQTICETEDTNYLKGMRRQTIGPIYGNVNIGSNKGEELYCKSNEIFVDSLEPFVEVATSF